MQSSSQRIGENSTDVHSGCEGLGFLGIEVTRRTVKERNISGQHKDAVW
jgi:hypothetical protein